METAFFRFYSRPENSRKTVYFTALITLLVSTAAFIALTSLFAQPIANSLHYPNNSEFITWFAIIVGLDAVSSIPLAYLRANDRPYRFAFVNLGSVFINIGLTVFFLMYCMPMYKAGHTNWLINTFYNPEIGVGYVFIANLAASIFKFLVMAPQMLRYRETKNSHPIEQPTHTPEKIFSSTLLWSMLIYGLPLLIAGLAGIINETLDRILLKNMLYNELGEEATQSVVGVYGGVYKISIIITLFIQAFRYAAEPFFFSESLKENAMATYARVMNWFVIVCASIFLFVMLFLDAIKYFTPKADYWQALHIVPILLFANIFLGIYYNQSVWYKVTARTMYGAWISVLGAAVTVVINVIFIPAYGYMACAWATFTCYAAMMVVSYLWGRRHYPVPYNIFKIILYLGLAFGLYMFCNWLQLEGAMRYTLHALVFLTFAFSLVYIERKAEK
jgi:O-antigen/teichoic acid export membrane protein